MVRAICCQSLGYRDIFDGGGATGFSLFYPKALLSTRSAIAGLHLPLNCVQAGETGNTRSGCRCPS
ncbi:MAG: hypothetical protein ACRCU2_00045 [Planktothrix sp.]